MIQLASLAVSFTILTLRALFLWWDEQVSILARLRWDTTFLALTNTMFRDGARAADDARYSMVPIYQMRFTKIWR